MDIASLDEVAARQVGELLRANDTSDVADAHLALLVRPDDRVLTSDESDLRVLVRTRGVNASIVQA